MSVYHATNTTYCPLQAYSMVADAICVSASPSLTLTQCPSLRKRAAKQAINPDLFFEFQKKAFGLYVHLLSQSL